MHVLTIADIYIAVVSYAHNVCPKGYYVAIVSTIAETEANHHVELEPGFQRLGQIEETFMGPPIPLYEPLEDGTKDHIYISKSYDATSHFETTTGEFLYYCCCCCCCFVILSFCWTFLTNRQQTMFATFTGALRATSLS